MATFHITENQDGGPKQISFCADCAQDEGLASKKHLPQAELLNALVMAQQPTGGSSETAQAACPTCRLKYADFRQSGLLGCPDCYRSFDAQLTPLLERAHDGLVEHRGKSPSPRDGLTANRAARAGDATPRADASLDTPSKTDPDSSANLTPQSPQPDASILKVGLPDANPPQGDPLPDANPAVPGPPSTPNATPASKSAPALDKSLKVSDIPRLKRELKTALEREDYETAATLRDAIRELEEL